MATKEMSQVFTSVFDIYSADTLSNHHTRLLKLLLEVPTTSMKDLSNVAVSPEVSRKCECCVLLA